MRRLTLRIIQGVVNKGIGSYWLSINRASSRRGTRQIE